MREAQPTHSTESAGEGTGESRADAAIARPPLPRGGDVLTLGLLLLHLLLVWWFPHFPTQDGPDYLQNSALLARLLRGDSPLAAAFYEVNGSPVANWIPHLALAALMSAASPPVAEKLLLSLYLVSFAAALRYALTVRGAHGAFLAALGFPFAFSGALYFGLYSFSWSVVLFFVVVGFWLRREGVLTARETSLLAVLSAVLCLLHPATFVMGALALCVLSLGWTGIESRRGAPWRRGVRRPASTAAALLPGAGLLAAFLAGRIDAGTMPSLPFGELLPMLAFMGIVSFGGVVECGLAAALTALIGGLALRSAAQRIRARSFEPPDLLAAVAAVFLAVFLLAPGGAAGGTLLEVRLAPFPFLVLLLWLSRFEFGRRARRLIAGCGAAVAIGLAAFHGIRHAEVNRYLAEYLSCAGGIRPGSTFLPLCVSCRASSGGGAFSGIVSPLLHAGALVTAERDVISLKNHEADTDHFPLRFRPGANPYDRLGSRYELGGGATVSSLDLDPPEVAIGGAGQPADEGIDYVLLWDGKAFRGVRDPLADELLRRLEAGFELDCSSPRGLSRLYRRR